MSSFRVRLARHLGQARRSSGLTQEQLAKLLSCSQRTVERAEAPTGSTPRDELITNWERVTGVRLLSEFPAPVAHP
jgi:transcriptional regulator with XRE-family HTH domain